MKDEDILLPVSEFEEWAEFLKKMFDPYEAFWKINDYDKSLANLMEMFFPLSQLRPQIWKMQTKSKRFDSHNRGKFDRKLKCNNCTSTNSCLSQKCQNFTWNSSPSPLYFVSKTRYAYAFALYITNKKLKL